VNNLVTVLLGETLKIICQATGIPKPIIDWKREGNTLVSGERTVLNGEQLVTHQVKENDSGVYTCVASNVIGNDELSSTVDVWVPPTVVDDAPTLGHNHLLIGSNGNATVGQSLIILCPVSGNPQPLVTWYKESQTNEIAWNVTSITINNITLADDGTYGCSAVNDVGNASRQSTITVTETESPPCYFICELL
jgi:hypothetical protein